MGALGEVRQHPRAALRVCSGVTRDRVEPATSPAMSAMPPKAKVRLELQRTRQYASGPSG
jgi:hypothetical protein